MAKVKKGHETMSAVFTTNLTAPQPTGDGRRPTDMLFDSMFVFGYGRFQWLVLQCALLATFVAYTHTIVVRIDLQQVKHWCRPPPGHPQAANITGREWKNRHIPRDPVDGTFKQCVFYSAKPPAEPVERAPILKRREEVPCDAWEFDSGYAGETVLMHWNLVCQRSWYQPAYRGAFVAGSIISVPCVGFASDFFGRKPLLRFALGGLLASGIVTSVAATLDFFILWRVVTSAAATTLEVVSYIVLFESTPPGPREAYCALAVSYPTMLAPVYVALAAQATRHWRYLHAALLLPAVVLVLLLAATRESPHWLMTHGFTDRARDVAVWAAKLNKEDVDVVKGRMDRLEKIIHSPEFHAPAASFYRSRGVLSQLLVVCGCWWLVFVTYYHGSLDLFAPSTPAVKWIILSGNVPAMTFAYYVTKHHGRVRLLEGSLLATALLVGCEAAFRFLGQPLPPELAFLWRVLLLNVAYVLLCVHTVANFPTKVRIVAFCLAYLSGRLGSLCSELVRLFENQLREDLRALPLAMVALGLGIFALLLGTPSERDLCRPSDRASRTTQKQRRSAAYRRDIERGLASASVSTMPTS
ncbi:solute carrier family 22 member 7-like [Haemaphysalis longicornis]